MVWDLTGGYAGFLGIFTLISALVLIAWGIGKVGMKVPILGTLAGAVVKIPGKFIMVFVAAGVVLWLLPAFGLGVIPQSTLSAAQNIGADTSQAAQLDAQTGTGTCVRNPNAATQNYLLTVENKDNPADAYLAGTADFVADDMRTVYNTGTLGGGATLSYTTVTVPHCVTGKIIYTNNASFAKAFSADQPQKQDVIDGALRTTTRFFALNYQTGANITAAGTPCATAIICNDNNGNGSGLRAQTLIVQNFTLASGGSQNVKFEVDLAASNGQYGAYNAPDGVIFGAYISDLTAFSASKGVMISSIDNGVTAVEVTCPADISANRRANKCWRAATLKSDRTYTVLGTVNADLGDPANDYIDLFADDVQYFKDTDGLYKYGSFAADGTNVGATGGQMRWLFN